MVLHDLDLHIGSEGITAILGRSGSGKTTLLNMISGIDKPDCGEILLGGQALSDLGDQERTLVRRRSIGFIFQFFNLIPTLTVWENVLLPLELNNLNNPQGKERARDLLKRVNLADRADAYPDRLSGGEQQRIAIARALVHEPLLILADEPTGNLDEETGSGIMDLLTELARQTGRHLILVTHSLEAANRADVVHRLKDGRLVEWKPE